MSDFRTFCVVETFEHDVRCFSACPSIWVTGNTLCWPPAKQFKKARKAYEMPEAHWKQCQVVQIVEKNIDGLELALASEKRCLNGSSEDARREQKQFKRKHPVLGLEQDDNFNLNKKFKEHASKDGTPNPSNSQTTQQTGASSFNKKFQELTSKTPRAKGGKPEGKTTKSYSQNTPNVAPKKITIGNYSQNKPRYKKQRIDSDDSPDGISSVQETATYVDPPAEEISSDEVDAFDIEGHCSSTLRKISNYQGN